MINLARVPAKLGQILREMTAGGADRTLEKEEQEEHTDAQGFGAVVCVCVAQAWPSSLISLKWNGSCIDV